jgi:hypothetical protein
MEIEDNEGGGKTVTLLAGDDLNEVPKSHRHLITAPVRDAFADPADYFGRLARRCPFPKMSRWLRALVAEDQWELHLNQGFPKEWTMVGFTWYSEKVWSGTIALPDNPDLSRYPKVLKKYYSLVDGVHWNVFGCAGGLEKAHDHMPLTGLGYKYHGDKVDLGETFVWGSSGCGDMLIYTSDGRGGWLCHENGYVHLLGKIEEAIDWVYAELLADRCPNYDYDWNK